MYQLQLFADLNDVFANKYLHTVDSDSILISEVYHIAATTCTKLEALKTKKADYFIANLEVDEYGNVSANFDLNGEVHTIRLNERIVRRGL